MCDKCGGHGHGHEHEHEHAEAHSMKLAVTGKGGVGKTTISALLAKALSDTGRKVIAIDADPNANLLACMGYREAEAVRPLVELNDLIEERTGAAPGTIGGMFKLNPRVDDIPDKCAVNIDGVKVLVAGAVKRGGSGCYCPENAFVRALVSHLLLDQDTALILDMEAGIEHLSRWHGRGGGSSAHRRRTVAAKCGHRLPHPRSCGGPRPASPERHRQQGAHRRRPVFPAGSACRHPHRWFSAIR